MDESNLNPAQPSAELTADPSSTVTLFPVVGIGASAGGLRALQRFLSHTPPDTGLAFVIVTHLSPEHESHMPALLQSSTTMPVIQVSEEIPLTPNHVYIIPPGRNLQTLDSHLRLAPMELERRQRAPIDHFLRTLAGSHDSLAIGVILTGTGSDGALGIRRIKEVGGLTVVQDPTEAEYDAMPQAALATGAVEMVWPVAEIPARLVEYEQNKPQVRMPQDGEPLPEDVGEVVQKILTQVRAYTGQDFLRYKSATILRRIRRRMQIQGFATLSDYLKYLRDHTTEVLALYHDFLITVTSFFRDPEAFAYLEHEVIPKIFQGKNGREGVRVWTVGCATGEEAYSVAILLLEYAGGIDHPIDIQIFASDLSEDGLRQAREGFYPETIAADVSPERLERFFTKEQGGYRIRQAVREQVLFTPHSLLKDPPFSRIDLICCRNLLIYVQRDAQQEVMQLFHYALRPEGYLFLGTAETVEGSELFREVNRKYSLYQRQPVASQQLRLPSLPLTPGYHRLAIGPTLSEVRRPGPSYGELHSQALDRYAPPSILVNTDQNIVYFAEGASRYLQQPAGEPTNQVLSRLRTELRADLMAALYRAQEKNAASQSAPIALTLDGQLRQVSLVVQPLLDPELSGFVLIFFLESAADEHPQATLLTADQSDLVHNLETELAETQKRLQINLEEYETSQEEMRAVNEELQSMNEELRSAAEELETSKEELHSVNEELMTVNQENKNKIEELNQLTGDLQNLLASTEIATLFLDRDLRIKRFTPRISDLFNVLSTDRGRPLVHITHKLSAVNLQSDAQQVLRTLLPIEREVQSNGAAWYIMRLLPYRTPDDRIDGVVITFVDITLNKANELALHNAKEYAESIVHTIPNALLVLDPDLRVQMANDAFYEIFQVSRAATEGRLIYELGNNQWQIPALRTLLEDILPENKVFVGYEVNHTFASIGRRTMLLNGRRLDHVQLILLAITDITDRKAAEEALAASEEKYRTLFETIDEGFVFGQVFRTADDSIDYRYEAVNPAWEQIVGLRAEDVVGRTASELLPGLDKTWYETVARAGFGGETINIEEFAAPIDKWLDTTFSPIGPGGQGRVAILLRDVTERRRHEANLAFLAEVSVDFAPLASVEEVMASVGVRLARHLNLSRCHFSLVEEEADRITTLYDWRVNDELPSVLGEHHISTFLSAAGREQYRAGQMAVVNDVRHDPLISAPPELMAHLGIGAVVAAPYLEEGHWKFLLSACRPQASVWRADEIELIRELTARIYIRLQRARAEEALRQSEERFRTLVQNVRDYAIFMTDADGIITEWTEGAQRVSGYTAAEVIGQHLALFYPPDELAAGQPAQELAEAAQMGRAEREGWRLRKGGERFIVNEIATAIRDENGALVGFTKISRDITERKQAEEALRASEAQLAVELADTQQLQEFSSLLIHEEDLDALHQQLIAAAVAIMGADAGSVQMLNPSQNELHLLAWTGFDPASAAFWAQVQVNASSSCGVALARRERVIVPDVESSDFMAGSEDQAYYRLSGIRTVQSTPLVARSGEIVGMLSTHWRATHEPSERQLRIFDVLARQAADLIERKKAEEALRQSEERLRLLIESAKDYAIFTLDTERRVTSWNRGAEAIFGYSESEILGQSDDIIFTPEDRAQHAPQQEAATALATGRAADERWHLRKDGSRFYASGVLTPLSDGELRGFVKIERDLTAEQQAIAERERLLAELAQERVALQKLNATLEKRVEDRTATLAAKNRELDRFAYLAAHDLKEPLRGIQRLADWIEEDAGEQLPAAAQTHLARLQQRVQRITQLVDDLLAYSRVGRMSYSLEMVDSAALIQNVVALLDLPPGSTVSVHEPMPRLATARVPLETVFLNLIHNAIKHHHQPASCQVDITAQEQGTMVEFAVSDNGLGIEPPQQERIFELFQTLRPRDEIEGSGMGLPIVQRILESYGGSIQVESSPAGGATFRFTWPREL